MSKQTSKWGRHAYIGISVLSLISVSFLSLADPQATMDLVNVQLGNTDALSSIRGVYGGVGLSICIALVYLWIKQAGLALRFLTLFWGLYAISRLLTIMADGPLGAFGTQWIITESVLCVLGIILIFSGRNTTTMV
jgi:hypothetical protein